MKRQTDVINKIDSMLNGEMEYPFVVKELNDWPSGDGSKHFRMTYGDKYAGFGVMFHEMAAYMWECPGEGRLFLKELEKHAEKLKVKLVIPTVLNLKLERILKEEGYTMKEVLYMDDICELWTKEA